MATPRTTPEDVTVTPRDLHFDTQAVGKGAWLGGDVVGTAVFNALSLTFPDGERLFMDAVRHYRPKLSGKLLDDAKAFITQEAIHSREHVAMNGGLDRNRYPVAAIEAQVKERTAMVRGRGPMAMLGATIALEHFTSMMADSFMREDDLFKNTDPEMKRLWQWHALEETEHKAVAFDVFQEVTKGWKPLDRYRLRVRVMVLISIMFTRNITIYASDLLVADGMKRGVARAKVLWFLFGTPGLFRRCANEYWAWYRPSFHPWDHDNRARLMGLRDQFTPAMAAE
ncbi:metal-dependent hydrolase [Caulobacter sp. ErkDOM-YI]|uniref:metal-dependent hydrolase n=1 Tax=unclassified Caulobacter TaxID=2648921 RepID=UPI003AF6E76E